MSSFPLEILCSLSPPSLSPLLSPPSSSFPLSLLPLFFSYSWKGEGLDEQGIDQNDVVRVTVNPKYYRPAEVVSTRNFARNLKCH